MDEVMGPGYVIEADDVPEWFPRAIEGMRQARLAARTIDGFYVEPTYDMWSIFASANAAGIRMLSCRAAGAPASWHEEVRSARRAQARLKNRRAAEWLPTFRASIA